MYMASLQPICNFFSITIKKYYVHSWSQTSVFEMCILPLSQVQAAHTLPEHTPQNNSPCIWTAATVLRPQLPAVLPNSTKRHYQKSHRDSHKSQSVLTSFIYSLPSKHIQDDSEKTRLKYLKLLKVITIWKETKFWMLDLPLTNFLSSFFHTHTHVLSGDYTVRTHSPTNHSTASAKITISSCVHHLLVWTMSITN